MDGADQSIVSVVSYYIVMTCFSFIIGSMGDMGNSGRILLWIFSEYFCESNCSYFNINHSRITGVYSSRERGVLYICK